MPILDRSLLQNMRFLSISPSLWLVFSFSSVFRNTSINFFLTFTYNVILAPGELFNFDATYQLLVWFLVPFLYISYLRNLALTQGHKYFLPCFTD